MEIGEKIKHLRHKANLTQEQLAGRLGLSAQSVSKWENAAAMPDITLLPLLAREFGVSIDDLFDLTSEERMLRIENRIETEDELPADVFREYEDLLKGCLNEGKETDRCNSLLAHLYHHRMQADARRVSCFAREAILRQPEKKECQWLLQMAEGHAGWDWNATNHTAAIRFYKEVIAADPNVPHTPKPYYYLIDNLLADHRAGEAEEYLQILKKLPDCNQMLAKAYEAYIALERWDVKKADDLMEKAVLENPNASDMLFEAAQYYARKCEYEKALALYERSYAAKENAKPRFADALQGIAMIYEIKEEYEKAVQTYDRILKNLRDEWGLRDECVVEQTKQ